jgi:ribonucleotide reductase beta subunit family protein with ferritin-like domain
MNEDTITTKRMSYSDKVKETLRLKFFKKDNDIITPEFDTLINVLSKRYPNLFKLFEAYSMEGYGMELLECEGMLMETFNAWVNNDENVKNDSIVLTDDETNNEKIRLKFARQLPEPILTPDAVKRWSLTPIQYPKFWEIRNTMEALHWVFGEIDMTNDRKDWDTKINDNTKFFLTSIFSFFLFSDILVSDNVSGNFIEEVVPLECKMMLTTALHMETIHTETYAGILDFYVKDQDELTRLRNAVYTSPSLKAKCSWALKWCNRDTATFAERIIAATIFEGLCFQSSFCCIRYIQSKSLLPSLGSINVMVSRDENLHLSQYCAIYEDLVNKLTYEEICEMMHEAVLIECDFVTESLPVELIGMNSTLMCQYVKFCADVVLVKIGHEKFYNVECPFAFMEIQGLEGYCNFFEIASTNYNKFGIDTTGKEKKNESLKGFGNGEDDEDF